MPRAAAPIRLALVLVPFLVACSGAAVAGDRGAGGEGSCGSAGSPEPEVPAVLPAGVYEAHVSLAYGEADPAWSAPLPEAAAAWLVVAEPESGGQDAYWFASGDLGWDLPVETVSPSPFRLAHEPGGGDVHFDFLAARGKPTCDPVVRFHARRVRLVPRDADGDGTAESFGGTIDGVATEEIPGHAADVPRTRSFCGELAAVPDRRPPAVVPAGSASPWGPFTVRFAEPVFFDADDFALAGDPVPVPLRTPWGDSPLPASPPRGNPFFWRPLESLVFFLPATATPLPPGTAVRLERLRIRDLAGNAFEDGPAEAGLRVVAPEGRPVASFEDGGLAGWVTEGPVQAVRSSPELPALDGDWLVAGSVRGGFSLAATVDVPDTDGAAFELAAFAAGIRDWSDHTIWIRVGAGDVVIERPLPFDDEVRTERFPLAELRGKTATVVVSLGLDGCDEGLDGTVVLDSFRVVP